MQKKFIVVLIGREEIHGHKFKTFHGSMLEIKSPIREEFPPVFDKEEEAEAWIKSNFHRFKTSKLFTILPIYV